MLLLLQDEADLNVIFEQREARARLVQTTEQPAIYVFGNLEKPKSIVKINTIVFEVETPEKAIDTCFKSFFALHVKFAPEAEQVWTYMENIIFKIYTETVNLIQ